jgi:hypothetical protein
MEDFTLPSVGGSLKKWVNCAHPFSQNLQALFLNFPKKKFKKIKTDCTESGIGPRPVCNRWSPAANGCPSLGLCNFF